MGDADHEVIVPVQEIEEWMDEALDVVDEGLGSLLEFIAHLNACTNQVTLKLKELKNFRRCFTAMQMLIVPIVIAIFLCYETSEPNYLKQTSKTSHVVDGLVTLLMFFSGSIGLPYYLFSIWEYYCQEEQINEENLCCGKENSQVFDAMPSIGENFNFLSSESSLERLNDIARMLSSRILERARREEDSLSFDRCREDNQDKKAEIDASDQFNDTPETNYEVKDSSEINDKGNTVGFPVLYEFQIRMREQSPDLAIKIEPQEAEQADLLGEGISETGIQLTTKQRENLFNDVQTSTSLL